MHRDFDSNTNTFRGVIRIPFAPWSGLYLAGKGLSIGATTFSLTIDAEGLGRSMGEPLPPDLFSLGRSYTVQLETDTNQTDAVVVEAILQSATTHGNPWQLTFAPRQSGIDYVMMAKEFETPSHRW